MARYIIISELTDEGAKTLKRNPGRMEEVNTELKEMGINVLDQYIVLGNFDFLTLVEAENAETVARGVVEILSRGSVRTSTYRVIAAKEFIEKLK